MYSLHIPLIPSIPAMPNGVFRFFGIFREHIYKGRVSSFLVSVTWTVGLRFEWTLKLPVFALKWFTSYKIIPTRIIELCWIYCFVHPVPQFQN
jgi:hypothetical protein